MSKMTSGVASAPLAQVDAPLLAVALAQGSVLPASLADLDRAAGGVVARVITSGDFKGKRDETTLLYPTGAKAERVLLVAWGSRGRSPAPPSGGRPPSRPSGLGRSAPNSSPSPSPPRRETACRPGIWARRPSRAPRKAPGRS